MSTPNIALFGGTFDPIHCGHLIVARCVLERLSLDGVTFIPSANPPHKGRADLSDVAHRLAMVERAIDGPRPLVGAEPGFACDDCETRRTGPSYTLDTVMHFRARLGPEATIHWIIGADSLAELESWHRVGELVDACNIVTVNRPSTSVGTSAGDSQPDLSTFGRVLGEHHVAKLKHGILQTPHIDISATDIRRRVAAAQSIRYLVPEPVCQYIEDHQLYRHAEL
ncbi:MAG: nicotinate (nicotinamide) nucleotide adenylyltransferase [Planctomycetota bacterium]|nr:nicotinate (nicotinamide) nucleotide adenylyltransferase [Planctomycetota bacterium]